MSEPTADQLRAKVFEDRETPGDWRVEKLNADGGYDAVKVFTGPDAWLQAIATPSVGRRLRRNPVRPRIRGHRDPIADARSKGSRRLRHSATC
jgi:hypothetical protein